MTVNHKIVSVGLLIVLIGVLGGLSGCASSAVTKAMVTDNIPLLQKHPYTVSVRTQGGSETGAIDVPNISNDDFAKAIEESIIKNSLFTRVIQPQDSDYSLNVAIISISKPLFGGSFTVSMETAWSLINTANKDIVMRESIKSSHTATMGDAFSGTTRFRFALEGAAQENIRLGLIAVSKLQLK
jgi:hypothetical protein